MKWMFCLAGYDITVENNPGAVHKVPDALSQLETEGLDKKPLHFDLSVLVVESPSDGEIEKLPPNRFYNRSRSESCKKE
jgi:hypothetical protein